MAVIETLLQCDLKKPVQVKQLTGNLFSLDNDGNLIGVRVTSGGQPVVLEGVVTGYCILADGQTVVVTGDNTGIVDECKAYIILPQLAYSVPGQISIIVKLTNGSTITTLGACTGYVYRSRTSNEVVPAGTPIPDLATMEEAIQRANTAASNANTAASSANTAATGAERVNMTMSKTGKVITLTTTDRTGESTSKTVTEPTLTVQRANDVVTVTATDADGQTSVQFDAVDADEVAELQEAVSTKAEEDGYYEELTAGSAEQLVSTEAVTDTTPYLYRKSGGSVDIGNRATLEKIVGGTVGWNQFANNSHAPSSRANLTITGLEDGFTITGTASEDTPASGWFGLANPSPIAQNHVCMSVFALVSGTVSNLSSVQISLSGTSEGIHYLGSSKVFRTTALPTSSYLGIANGTVFTDAKLRVQLFDLTAMFGPTIADYIYNLETATPGAGVTWFRKLFPKDFYQYNPGELISVKPSSHDMVGFNLWDEEWEVGSYDIANGQATSYNDRIRSKNYIHVMPNTTYYGKVKNTPDQAIASNANAYFCMYDENKVFLGYSGNANEYSLRNREFTTLKNCHYLRFYCNVGYGATYNHDICINLSHSGSRNGEYEPYEKHSYPLADVELRGPLAIDADGKLVYSGDEYPPDGKVNRRFNVVDLGTLNWGVLGDSYPNQFIINTPFHSVKAGTTNTLMARYYGVEIMPYANQPDKTIMVTSNKYIVIKDTSYADAAAFKAAMSGVYLLYELATPTTETVTPYTPVQVVDDWGTEEFVDTREVAIPVGHSTSYMANLRDKLQHLPSLADGDGEYIVKQTGSQMSLVGLGNTNVTKMAKTEEDDADLYVADADGNVLAQFSGGHIQTQNFDSSEIGDLDNLETTDKSSIVEAINEVKSDSGKDVPLMEFTNSNANIDIADSNGNVIVRFENGHIKTKNFDSSDIKKLPIEYKFSGSDLLIGFGYNNTHDAVIVMNAGRANGLFDFSAFKLKTKDVSLKNIDTSDLINVWTSGTDMHSSFQFLVTSNADGYYSSATDPSFTGGSHTVSINGNEVQTANSQYIYYFADGKPVTDGNGWCNHFEIKWANEIQAYNCVKADGTGRASLVEYHDMIFDGIRFNEEIRLVPLEEIKIGLWYGLQTVSWGTTYNHIRFRDAANRGVYTSSDSNIVSGNAATSGIEQWGQDHALETTIDITYDLGKRDFYIGTGGAFTSGDKTYYRIIFGQLTTLPSNTGYYLRGSYRFYPVV